MIGWRKYFHTSGTQNVDLPEIPFRTIFGYDQVERKRIRSNRKLNRLILPTWLASHQVNMQNEKYLLANWLQTSEDVSLETGEPRELPWNVAMKWIHPKKSIDFCANLQSMKILMWDIPGFFSFGMSGFLGGIWSSTYSIGSTVWLLVVCICYA